MATLFFTVWEVAGSTPDGAVLQEESISIGAASVQGSAITGSGKRKRQVRIFCDADAFVTWGSDPTASSSDGRPMGQDNPEYFTLEAGQKIATIERA